MYSSGADAISLDGVNEVGPCSVTCELITTDGSNYDGRRLACMDPMNTQKIAHVALVYWYVMRDKDGRE